MKCFSLVITTVIFSLICGSCRKEDTPALEQKGGNQDRKPWGAESHQNMLQERESPKEMSQRTNSPENSATCDSADGFHRGLKLPRDANTRSQILDDLIIHGEGHESALAVIMGNKELGNDERMMAARALVGIGNERAIQLFAEVVTREPDERIRTDMMACLEGLQSAVGIEMLASLFSQTQDKIVLDGAEDALSRLANPDTIGYLRELAEETKDGPYEIGVLQAIGSISNSQAMPALTEIVQSPSVSEPLYAAALKALAKSETRAGVVGLLSAWDHASDATRKQKIVQSIAEMRGEEVMEALRGIALDSPSPEIKAAAKLALERDHAERGPSIRP